MTFGGGGRKMINNLMKPAIPSLTLFASRERDLSLTVLVGYDLLMLMMVVMRILKKLQNKSS